MFDFSGVLWKRNILVKYLPRRFVYFRMQKENESENESEMSDIEIVQMTSLSPKTELFLEETTPDDFSKVREGCPTPTLMARSPGSIGETHRMDFSDSDSSCDSPPSGANSDKTLDKMSLNKIHKIENFFTCDICDLRNCRLKY